MVGACLGEPTMRLWPAFVIAALIPAAAAAQTTSCRKDATGAVICLQEQPRKAADIDGECVNGGLQALAEGCTLGQISRAKRNDTNRKAVGALIADSKCAEAKSYALRSGDLDLAERVLRLCAPPQEPR